MEEGGIECWFGIAVKWVREEGGQRVDWVGLFETGVLFL